MSDKRKPAGGSTLIVVAIVLLASAAISRVAWVALNEGEPAKGAAKAEPVEKETKSKPVTAPKKVVPKEKPAETPELPPKSREQLFRDAMVVAQQMGEEADGREPELTRKAEAVLTFSERTSVGFAMGSLKANLHTFKDVGFLIDHGMTAAVARQSRKVARSDDAFRGLVEVFWDQSTGAEGLLGLMNMWGAVPPLYRSLAIAAVKNNLRADQMLPDARDGILALGGRKWLEGGR